MDSSVTWSEVRGHWEGVVKIQATPQPRRCGGGGHHPLWDPDGISTPWGTQAARFSLPLALHVPSTAAQLCKEPRALGAEHPQLALCLPQASVCRHPSGHVDVIPVRAEDPRVSWLPLPGALQKHHPRLRSHMGCSKPVSAKVVL